MTLAIDPPIFLNPRPPRRIPHYQPPARFLAYRDRFAQRVIYPDANPFDDDTYWDKCRLWMGEPTPNGQHYINVYSVRVSIYRFAYELEVGLIQSTHVARTVCDMTACVNTRHMILRQRRHSAVVSNLDPKSVEDIRWLFHDEHAGVRAARLAEIFGVTERRIYQIVEQRP